MAKLKLTKNLAAAEIRKNKNAAATRCPDLACAEKMEEAIVNARKEGDSLGGIIECIALNMPAGIGEPLFDSLDADLAKALFAVPAVKGVEFGAGFKAAELTGSENNDAFLVEEWQSCHFNGECRRHFGWFIQRHAHHDSSGDKTYAVDCKGTENS